DQRLGPLAAKTLVQSVIEGAQIGCELLLHVTGQEAEAFAGLDRRTGKHDAAHLVLLEGFDGFGYGDVGFAGSRRPQRQHDGTLFDGVHQLLLQRAHRPYVFYILSVAAFTVAVQRTPAAGRKERMHIVGFISTVAVLATRGTLCHGYSLDNDRLR